MAGMGGVAGGARLSPLGPQTRSVRDESLHARACFGGDDTECPLAAAAEVLSANCTATAPATDGADGKPAPE